MSDCTNCLFDVVILLYFDANLCFLPFTACPKSETIYAPCDPMTGRKKMIVVSYVPKNCMCKRLEEEHSVSCRCGVDKPSFGKSVCNVLRREISMEGTLKEWRDDINQCVDVVKRIIYPHSETYKLCFLMQFNFFFLFFAFKDSYHKEKLSLVFEF